jgi:DNA polymerase III delta subunit
MLPKKNIHLFRWENKEGLRKTIDVWRNKFIEKHGELNLLEINNETIFNSILWDCLAPGFMGGTRMIIFHEKLIKTDKEQEKIEAQKKTTETTNMAELLEDNGMQNMKQDDAVWIETMGNIPDTNFIIFVGNKKPITELEKWLEKNASLHEFSALSVEEIITYIESNLRLTRDQAGKMSDRLSNNYDIVVQEVKKLSLAYQPKWTDEELKNILPDYRDENAFNMLEPLWNRDPKTMISVWQRLMETADHELTMAMMITMMRKILISASFSRIQNLPITPGQRNTGKRLLSQKKSLKKLFDDIVEVDIAEKSGELPHKTNAFLMALLSFC